MADQVFPTKGNLISTKKSLLLAKVGFELLDRKRNIIVREMMALIDPGRKQSNPASTPAMPTHTGRCSGPISPMVSAGILPRRCRWRMD